MKEVISLDMKLEILEFLKKNTQKNYENIICEDEIISAEKNLDKELFNL